MDWAELDGTGTRLYLAVTLVGSGGPRELQVTAKINYMSAGAFCSANQQLDFASVF